MGGGAAGRAGSRTAPLYYVDGEWEDDVSKQSQQASYNTQRLPGIPKARIAELPVDELRSTDWNEGDPQVLLQPPERYLVPEHVDGVIYGIHAP